MKETTRKVVEELLKTDPKCRTDDKWLYIETLRRMGYKIWIDYKELKNMPFPETVSRMRRSIQNQENKYNDFISDPEKQKNFFKPTMSKIVYTKNEKNNSYS